MHPLSTVSLFLDLGSALDVSPISEVIAIKSKDTFVRTVYAGNAIMTLKSLDAVKVMTVRATNFEATGTKAAEAPIESGPAGDFKTDLSEYVSQELAKSDRPALTAAGCIVSGGTVLLLQ